MNIDSIQNGVVLDHIQAGKSMDIYRYLHLDQLDCSVAIIKNVRSGRMGKKDIIKIDSPMEVDLDVLGYIDPNITVNIIRDGVRVEKKHVELPKKLVNIIHCKNPRCITVAEPQLDILYMTRVQKERFFNEEDYLRLKDSYILTPEKLENAKADLSILHPLPRVNEITVAVDKDPRAAYWRQVKNGKYIRMALILKLLGIQV